MKQISSPSPKLEKFLVPALPLAFMFSLTLLSLFAKNIQLEISLGLGILSFFFLFQFYRLYWTQVDNVYEEDSKLVFEKGDKRQIVAYSDIDSLEYSHSRRPGRVEVYTKLDGEIGRKLVFNVKAGWLKIGVKNGIVNYLRLRITEARNSDLLQK